MFNIGSVENEAGSGRVMAVVRPRKVSTPSPHGPASKENKRSSQTKAEQDARLAAQGHDPKKTTIWNPYA